MSQALQRLDIDMKEGLYHVKQISGAEVNISEELFNYLVAGFEHTNTILKPKSVDTSIVRLKYGFMEGDWLYGDSTYCVAYALAGMGGSLFWESKSIYRQYLRSKWSAGVCDGFRNIAFLSECKAI